MNCKEFKSWMLDIKAGDPASRQSAQAHIAVCAKCEKLYSLDLALEKQFGDALNPISPPMDLISKIERDLDSIPSGQKKSNLRWKLMAPALATAAVVLLIFVNSLMDPMRGIERIGSLALANHLDNRHNLAFNAGEVADVAAWFAKRIGFAAAPPKLDEPGLVFKGGRQCKLGPKKAAYLIYQKDGKKCSLFIINPADLDFKLEKNRKFSVKENDHDIKIWSESDLVYAMVL